MKKSFKQEMTIVKSRAYFFAWFFELELKLVNDNRAKKLSVVISLGLGLSFQRGGFKTSVIERIDTVGPNESKTLFYQIWPKHDVRFGEMPIRIRVLEHGESYAQILKQD